VVNNELSSSPVDLQIINDLSLSTLSNTTDKALTLELLRCLDKKLVTWINRKGEEMIVQLIMFTSIINTKHNEITVFPVQVGNIKFPCPQGGGYSPDFISYVKPKILQLKEKTYLYLETIQSSRRFSVHVKHQRDTSKSQTWWKRIPSDIFPPLGMERQNGRLYGWRLNVIKAIEETFFIHGGDVIFLDVPENHNYPEVRIRKSILDFLLSGNPDAPFERNYACPDPATYRRDKLSVSLLTTFVYPKYTIQASGYEFWIKEAGRTEGGQSASSPVAFFQAGTLLAGDASSPVNEPEFSPDKFIFSPEAIYRAYWEGLISTFSPAQREDSQRLIESAYSDVGGRLDQPPDINELSKLMQKKKHKELMDIIRTLGMHPNNAGMRDILKLGWGRNGKIYLGYSDSGGARRDGPRENIFMFNPFASCRKKTETRELEIGLSYYGNCIQVIQNPVDNRWLIAFKLGRYEKWDKFLPLVFAVFSEKELEKITGELPDGVCLAEWQEWCTALWRAKGLGELPEEGLVNLLGSQACLLLSDAERATVAWSLNGQEITIVLPAGRVIDWDLESKSYVSNQLPLQKQSDIKEDACVNMSAGGIFASFYYPRGIVPFRKDGKFERSEPFIEIWNVKKAKLLARLIITEGIVGDLLATFFASIGWAAGERLIFTNMGIIYSWEWNKEKTPRELAKVNTYIVDLKISPDGRLLAVATSDFGVYIIDSLSGNRFEAKVLASYQTAMRVTPTVEPVQDARGINALCWSLDSSLLLTGQYGRLTIWQVESVQHKTLAAHSSSSPVEDKEKAREESLILARRDQSYSLKQSAAYLAAIRKAIQRLRAVGELEQLLRMSFFELADAIGAIEINDPDYAYLTRDFIFHVGNYERVKQDRRAFMIEHKIEGELTVEKLLATIPNLGYITPENRNFPVHAGIHPEIKQAGIYYHRGNYERAVNIDPSYGHNRLVIIFHELLEEEFSGQGSTDEAFHQYFKHAHPYVSLAEILFAALLGEIHLNESLRILEEQIYNARWRLETHPHKVRIYKSPQDAMRDPIINRRFLWVSPKEIEDMNERTIAFNKQIDELIANNEAIRYSYDEAEGQRQHVLSIVEAFETVAKMAREKGFREQVRKALLERKALPICFDPILLPPESSPSSSPVASRLIIEELEKFGVKVIGGEVDLSLVPENASWVMRKIRPQELISIYLNFQEAPGVELIYPAEESVFLTKHTNTLYLGLAKIQGEAQPVVNKLFSEENRLKLVNDDLIKIQVADRLGISPRFYGLIKDKTN